MRKAVVIMGLAFGLQACQSEKAQGVAPTKCNLMEISPSKLPNGKPDVLSIDNPDSDTLPTAWQGPIHLKSSKGFSCDFAEDIGIISKPFLFDGNDRLFFTAYSGSNQNAFLLGIQECKILWKSTTFGAGSISSPAPSQLNVAGKNMLLKPDCVPAE
ncbi:MAG: hypothetical protein ABI673_00505 [Novosphingobium sp.]